MHEQWRRIREQAPAQARRFNDVPTRLLRAIDDFCEATGCEALRAAHFEEAQEDLVYFTARCARETFSYCPRARSARPGGSGGLAKILLHVCTENHTLGIGRV